MMKRPLCCLCLAYVVSVLIYLLFFKPSFAVNVEEGQWKTYYGMVYDKELLADRTILYLKHVQNLQASKSQEENYDILCYYESAQVIPPIGSYVIVSGKITFFKESRNPGEFNQRKYYEIENIAFALENATLLQCGESYDYYREGLFQIKQKLSNVFDCYMSESDASVMKAILLGDKKNMDKDRKSLFQKSGISHILAISGLHISILGMGLYKLLTKCKVPIFPASGLAISFMLVYGDLVGMSSSAARAIIMFLLQLGAILLKRTYDRKAALAVAAIGILIEQPLYLFQAGFLLSFGAILGISYIMPLFGIENTKQKRYASLSILLVQLPIMLYYFYGFSLYAILVNLVIIPLVGILLLLGLCCLVAGSIPWIGVIFGTISAYGCHAVISLFEKVCDWSLKLPNAQCILGRPSMWKIILYYSVLLFLCVLQSYLRKQKNRLRFSYQMKMILIFTALQLFTLPTETGMRLAFLDVGQGDCIWIENDNGHHYLIDCGSTSKSKVGTYTLIPFLKYKGVSQIDMIFVTHLDEDHISGIRELLENEEGIKIKQLLLSSQIPQNESFEVFMEQCRKEKIPVSFVKQGDCCIDNQLSFEVLYPAETDIPQNANDSSLIIKMEYGNFHALFTGDAQASGEIKIIESLKDWQCHVFKVTHHGSAYSNTEQLLETIKPQMSVISCGENNTYGHPHAETLERLAAVKSHILMTKNQGEIEINVKNAQIAVTTYLP